MAAITVSIADMTIPPKKYELVAASEQMVVDIENQYKMGFMTDHERYKQVVQVWEKTTDEVSDALQENLDRYNPIFMMADSGARGSMKQIRQLAGMRGLIANTAGQTIEIPIKANYREGLTALEYFISSRGARKGLADTALRTADSGYLTRRMVDVSQDVIIREQDCGVTHGIKVSEISENGQVIEKFSDRVRGRYPGWRRGGCRHRRGADPQHQDDDGGRRQAHGDPCVGPEEPPPGRPSAASIPPRTSIPPS